MKVEYEFEFDVEAAADFIPHMRKLVALDQACSDQKAMIVRHAQA